MNVSSLNALRMALITLLLTTVLRKVLGERRFIYMCCFALLVVTVFPYIANIDDDDPAEKCKSDPSSTDAK